MFEDDIGALGVIEKHLGLSRSMATRRFLRMKRWIVAERRLIADVVFHSRQRPKLARLDVSLREWLRAYRSEGSSRLALACCALYEGRKSRRAFYLGRGLTIKLLPRDESTRTRKDIEARSLIAATGALNIPKVLASASLADRAYLVEELVTGTHPAADHQEKILEALIPSLWTTYRALGFATIKAFPQLEVEMIKHQLSVADIPPQMTYERECRDELLRRLIQLPTVVERPLLAAYGHGDLSIGNIIVSHTGALFVVDWETAGLMPVVWDLRKLIPTVPAWSSKAVELLRRELGRLQRTDLMSAEDQWILGLAARIAERSRKAQLRGQSSADQKTLRELRRAANCLRA